MEVPPSPPNTDGVPADIKTWAEFNTWFALNNPDARLKDFNTAWISHKEYLSTVKKPRKPRAPKPKQTVDEVAADVKPKKVVKPRKKVE